MITRYRRNILLFFIPMLFTNGIFADESTTIEWPEPQELINLSTDNWRRGLDAIRDYTYQKRRVTQVFNKNGELKISRIETYEISIIFGKQYSKLIAIDDKPLSVKDQKNEEKKLDKFFDKQRKMSDKDREKELEKENLKLQREIADELPQMLSFEIIGDEILDGYPVWVLSATPRKGYKPRSNAGKLLSKMSGKIWVTKAGYKWVKLEADIAEDVNFGWFLFKLRKGARIEIEQVRINDEVWLPKRVLVSGAARVAVINAIVHDEATYSKYQKFTSDVKITY